MLNRIWPLLPFGGAFLVTLLVVLWQRHTAVNATGAVTTSGGTLPGPTVSRAGPTDAPAVEVSRPEDARRPAIASAVAVAPAVQQIIAAADPNAPPEPLPLAINPLPYRGHPGMHWVDIINFSKDALTISVSLTNDTTGKSLRQELMLSSRADAVLGKDNGWEIETGDTLTVTSPKFVDRVLTIS